MVQPEAAGSGMGLRLPFDLLGQTIDLPGPGPSRGGKVPSVSNGKSRSIVNEEEPSSLDLVIGLRWLGMLGLATVV